MATAFRLFLILLFLTVVTPIVIAASFWSDADDQIARATQGGALNQTSETKPLSIAERVIAADQFSQTWGSGAFPCRTLSLLWTDLSDPDARPPATPVSQRAATSMLGDRRGASVRWQMRRLLVACQLEQHFNDAQLLRVWLAKASFGPQLVGITTAARSAFAKQADELNIDESVRLAALLHEPSLRTQPARWTTQEQAIRARVVRSAQ